MKSKNIEKRARPIELRMADEESREIGGYAIVYNEWTTIGDWYREKILPGAATEVLQNSDIRLLFNHDTSQLLAREKSGTLSVSEDVKGVSFSTELSEHRTDILSMIRRKDLDECSFAFLVEKESWRWASDNDDLEMDERIIEKFSIIPELTLATFGAYPTTDVGIRSAYDSAKAEHDEQRTTEQKEQLRIKQETAKRGRTLTLLSFSH